MAGVGPFEAGIAAAEAGDFEKAAAIARILLARNPGDVNGLQIAGFVAFRQGRNTDALEAFLRAWRIAPDRPTLLYWIGVLYKERGDYQSAERAFRDAVSLDPGYGEAWCHLGETRFMIDRKENAREAFEAALKAEPTSPVVLARAARFFETTHDLARARALLEDAFHRNPDDGLARIALLELDLREGRCEAVVAGATALLRASTSADPRNEARINHLLASALDRLGDCQGAFTRYAEAKRLVSRLDHDLAHRAPSPLHTESLDRLRAFTAAADFSQWTSYPDLQGPAPVFLLGFVRSGTTWLDQVLSSHPSVTVTEEEDLLIDSWRELALSDDGLRRLAPMSKAEIERRRAAYWTRVDRVLGGAPRREVFVDKLPLNTANLPLIWRLFPEAKILFAIRDPRDAVLSAFQQHFQVNVGMAHFLDIGSGAAFYDRVMAIGAIMRERTPLRIHDIRYERVVSNFETEIRVATGFLGLPWTDAVLDYQETARRRVIRTPSARQVIEKPYATSIGKWRRYRDAMAPALPILAPWVERFGYPQD